MNLKYSLVILIFSILTLISHLATALENDPLKQEIKNHKLIPKSAFPQQTNVYEKPKADKDPVSINNNPSNQTEPFMFGVNALLPAKSKTSEKHKNDLSKARDNKNHNMQSYLDYSRR